MLQGVVKRRFGDALGDTSRKKYANSTKSAKSTVDVGCIKVLRGLRGGGEGVVTGCRGVLFEVCLEIL